MHFHKFYHTVKKNPDLFKNKDFEEKKCKSLKITNFWSRLIKIPSKPTLADVKNNCSWYEIKIFSEFFLFAEIL